MKHASDEELNCNYSQRSQIFVENKQDRVKSDNNVVTGLRQQICTCTHNNKHYRKSFIIMALVKIDYITLVP